MGSLSIVHWIIIIAVALLLFGGRGKISSLMGDFAEGIKAFKKGMSEDETVASAAGKDAAKTIDHANAGTAMKGRSETENRVEGSTA